MPCSKRRTVFLAALTVAALASQAQAENQPSQISVSHKGLDLSNPHDADVFYRRLQIAAATVCGGTSTVFVGERPDQMVNCYHATLDDAVSKAAAPLVTAQFEHSFERLASR